MSFKLIQEIPKKWFNVKKKTTKSVESAKATAFRGSIFLISSILVVWISIFLYTAFYYAYMPNMNHIRPVHLQFKSCEQDRGICSFPSAYIQLTKKQQLLMVGQPYKVNLNLEMPESPTNKELGMFMVCAQLKSRNGILVDHACRSSMLHYRSSLLQMLTTFTFSPMMVFGNVEEKQNIIFELFSNFEEDQSNPVTVIYIEIQSRHIEFYSATLIISAHLSGLRYLMYHWPVLSAIVGIGTNLFFIVLICILSYLHFSAEDENFEESFTYEKIDMNEESECRFTGEIESDISTIEDTLLSKDILKSRKNSPKIGFEDPTVSKSSYIQELSSLLSKDDLNQ